MQVISPLYLMKVQVLSPAPCITSGFATARPLFYAQIPYLGEIWGKRYAERAIMPQRPAGFSSLVTFVVGKESMRAPTADAA